METSTSALVNQENQSFHSINTTLQTKLLKESPIILLSDTQSITEAENSFVPSDYVRLTFTLQRENTSMFNFQSLQLQFQIDTNDSSSITKTSNDYQNILNGFLFNPRQIINFSMTPTGSNQWSLSNIWDNSQFSIDLKPGTPIRWKFVEANHPFHLTIHYQIDYYQSSIVAKQQQKQLESQTSRSDLLKEICQHHSHKQQGQLQKQLTKTISNYKQRNHQLQEDNNQLQEENDELQEELSNKIQEQQIISSHTQERIQSLLSLNQVLENKLVKNDNLQYKVKELHKQQINHSNQYKRQLNHVNNDHQKTVTSLEKKIESLTTELCNSNKQNKQLLTSNKKLITSNQKIMKTNQKLLYGNKEYQHHNQELTEKLAQMVLTLKKTKQSFQTKVHQEVSKQMKLQEDEYRFSLQKEQNKQSYYQQSIQRLQKIIEDNERQLDKIYYKNYHKLS